MTLRFGEVGVVFGEGHLLISCNVLPQCGPNRISVDASYSGAFLQDSNEFAGTFITRTVGYYFELGPDGACLTRVWSDGWGALHSGSPQWRATLEDGVVRGCHVQEGQPPGGKFELIVNGP